MKLVKVDYNENNLIQTHIFGDPVIPQALEDYEFPGFAAFFGMIRLDEYPMCGKNEGNLYIFLDLSGYYSEEYGEYSMVPMAYYSKDNPEIIFDNFNEMNEDIKGFENIYMLDNGKGFDINDGIIEMYDEVLLDFFKNFTDDLKKAVFGFEELELNKFNEGFFNIIK